MSRWNWDSVEEQIILRTAGKGLPDAMVVCPAALTAHLPTAQWNWYASAYTVAYEVAQEQVRRNSWAGRHIPSSN